MSSRVSLWIAFGLLLFASPFLVAQFTTTSLSGVVTDSSGAVVPDARVTAENNGTSLRRTTSTGADGAYVFSALPVGTYALTVEKAGFAPYTQQGITLAVSQTVTLSVVLHPGTLSEKVTVSADASMLQTDNSTVSQLVTERQIVDLPLNGRQAQGLVYLTAGTYDTSNTNSNCCYAGYNSQGGVYPGAQFAQINGTGPVNTTYLVDGADNTDTYTNENFPFPNPDALREFSVQTGNMSAEYGQGTAVVNVVTKSGTNDLHGELFEFLRNGDLNARNFFAPTHDTLKRNQYGGALGGRIIKNKLFFFGSYQGTRTTQAPSGAVAFVPTAAERNGDFSAIPASLHNPTGNIPFPGNQIPASQLSGPAVFIAQHIPLPNGPNGQWTGLGATQRQHDDQFMPKVDYLAGKNQLSVRYFYSRFDQPVDVATETANALATNTGQHVVVQTASVSDTYVVSPSLLFSTWFGYERSTGGTVANAPFTYADAGIQVALPTGQAPTLEGVAVGGYFTVTSGHRGDYNRRDWKIREIVTKQWGPHEVHLGGDVFQIRSVVNNFFQQAPTFQFANALSGNNLSDFMLGDVTAFTQSAGQFYNYAHAEGDLFVQDNWRVTPRLTINMGLRWDPWWPYQNVDAKVTCFVPGAQSLRYPNAPRGLIYGGDPGCPAAGAEGTRRDFAPRVGFALRLDDKTVLRGGGGLYYGMPNADIMNVFSTVAPFTPTYSLTAVNFTNPYGSAGIQNPFPAQFGPANPGPSATFITPIGGVGTLPGKFPLPTIGTWNMLLQRQVGKNWSFDVGYVGNAGYHLDYNQAGGGAALQANPAVYIPGASTPSNVQARRMFPSFAGVNLYQLFLVSRYEALQVDVQKRFSSGLSLRANYTYSKLESDENSTDPYDMAFNWGIDRSNVPNVFHFSAVWQTPHAHVNKLASAVVNGWELTGITTWQNGFPLTVMSGVDGSLSGGTSRADFTGPGIGQASFGDRAHGLMIQQYFNTAQFVNNAIGTFGNSPLNAFQGPGLFDEDLAALKNFDITEKAKMQFRAEFFNAFNDVNLAQPGTTVGTGTYGKITSAQSPRILQFALKLMF